jgi:hypothetical protein
MVLSLAFFCEKAICDEVYWDARQTNEVLALEAVTWQPVEVVPIDAQGKGLGPQGATDFEQAFLISVFSSGSQGQASPMAFPVFGIRSKPATALTVQFGLSTAGKPFENPARIAVGWNDEIIGSVFVGEAFGKDNASLARQIDIPAAKVRETNYLWLVTGYGKIGLNSVKIDGSKTKFLPANQIGHGFDSIAAKRRYPELKCTGNALLLPKDNRKSTEVFRALVLDPLGIEVEESSLQQSLPGNWSAYPMVVISGWALPPLLQEDLKDIVKYINDGGVLYITSQGYWRLCRNLTPKDREELDQDLFGAHLDSSLVQGVPADNGYVEFERGSSPFAAFVQGDMDDKLDCAQPAPVPGNGIPGFRDFAPEEAVITWNANVPRAFSLRHPLGKGWIYVDGFDYLQPETIGLARRLVEHALQPADRR